LSLGRYPAHLSTLLIGVQGGLAPCQAPDLVVKFSGSLVVFAGRKLAHNAKIPYSTFFVIAASSPRVVELTNVAQEAHYNRPGSAIRRFCGCYLVS